MKNRLPRSRHFLSMIVTVIVAFLVWFVLAEREIHSLTLACYTDLSLASETATNSAAFVEIIAQTLSADSRLQRLHWSEKKTDYQRYSLEIDAVEALSQADSNLFPVRGKTIFFVDNSDLLERYWSILNLNLALGNELYTSFLESAQNSAWIGPDLIYPDSTVVEKTANRLLFCYLRKVPVSRSGNAGILKVGVPMEVLFSSLACDSLRGTCVIMREQVIYGDSNKDLSEHPGFLSNLIGPKMITLENEVLGIRFVASCNIRSCYIQAFLQILPTTLIVLLFAFLLEYYSSKNEQRLKQEVDHVLDLAEQVSMNEGNIHFDASNKNELGRLLSAFNRLIQEMQKRAEKQIAIEQSEKRAMMHALQYRMNPHFLFNSLNWLKMSLEMQGIGKEEGEALLLLSRLLRYNLQSEERASLSEEISMAHDYVRLMNLRKHETILLRSDINEIAPSRQVMRFLLQPLCENAIQHGIRPGNTLNIQVLAEGTDTELKITVSNDGKKIDPDKLKVIRENLLSDNTENGIGLSNVAQRLKLLYGESASLSIASDEICTKVSIYIKTDGNGGIEHEPAYR